MILSQRTSYKHVKTKCQYFTEGSREGTSGCFRVSLQYCVRWGSSMRPSRQSRLTSNKASEAGDPRDAADQLVVRRSRRRAQNLWAGLDDPICTISDKGTDQNLIDLIDDEPESSSASECRSPQHDLPVKQEKAVIGGKRKAPIEDVGDSDAESCSSLDSLASGPCFMIQPSPLDHPTGLCLTCQTLYREATLRNTPLEPLVDNDPTSLSCDQWVLQKRRPTRLKGNVKGRLWIHLRRIRNTGQTEAEREHIACSRPHIFLQRNLRLYERRSVVQRKRGRKRRKTSAGGGRQNAETHITQRHSLQSSGLQSSGLQSSGLQSSGLQSSGLQSSGLHSDPDGEADNGDDSGLEETPICYTFQVAPSSLTMETRLQATPYEEKKQRSRSGFRTLLDQFRCKSSSVIRETHT
ncbi:hypothetical protein UPYG_G00303720 [Umbra pygmaea]|uniref:Uncharacterized protein n=1 Tax=Umbra pygmaea TaxID=75934 RepID=A0ABD0W6U1_UMBPY